MSHREANQKCRKGKAVDLHQRSEKLSSHQNQKKTATTTREKQAHACAWESSYNTLYETPCLINHSLAHWSRQVRSTEV